MPVWLGEVNPAIWRKVSRHVIRTDSHVRTSVEVLLMYARFTEGTIDPKKREQAETIAESIFTAARKQKGFKGVSFCLDPKGEAVFLSLWDSKEAMQANEASGYYKEQVEKLKDVLIKPTTKHVGEVKAHEETHKAPKAARLTISGIRKDAEAQGTRLAQDVSRAARSEPGFVGWYGVLTEDSQMAAISFWDSADAMRRSEAHYLKDALGKLKEISTGGAQPKLYEVVKHQIPAVAAVR
jgi:heme-degrading monooxygenase HmoA